MDHVLFERDERVATITLNRPDRLNAITGPMLAGLSQMLLESDADPAVRAIVLTGAGRGFCAGLDLQAQGGGEFVEGAAGINLDDTPPFVLRRIDTPVLCALNGPAAGYGADLALGCDLIVASDTASITTPVKRGVLPESGGTWLLPRMVGWQRACEVFLLGRKLDAAELLRLGLVNTVVAHDQFPAVVAGWAEELAAQAPLAARAAKRAMRLGLDSSFEENSHYVMDELMKLFKSEDFAEGVKAFLERRPPSYQGR